MDLKTKLYQMFILGTEGDGYIQALEKGLGGMIFFTKDIHTKDQFKNLVSDIKSKALIPPFLSIDQEGARVRQGRRLRRGCEHCGLPEGCRRDDGAGRGVISG